VLSRRVRDIGHSPTLETAALAAKLRAEGVDVLDFSAGQPDFPTVEAGKRAGKEAIDADRTTYTANAGLIELRREIAAKLERDNGLSYPPEQILVSPGAKASLYFAMMALLDEGDEVLVPTPYWVSYPAQVTLAGARTVLLPADEDHAFKLSAEQLRGAITSRTKALILNYPSNPTGRCYTAEQLEPIAEACVERGIWVIADEIYEKLVYDGFSFTSIASLSESVRQRTIVVNGVSKTYAMTGWRIGYAAGPAEAISAMSKVQSHSTSNATSVSQWASLGAMRADPSELERRRREFERRRNLVVEGLSALGGVRCAMPEGAFYVFPNVSGLFGRRFEGRTLSSGSDVARFLLESARVAVVPGEAFGSADHIRISYAESLERVREGLERIESALGRLD